jgi:hypothetical protein
MWTALIFGMWVAAIAGKLAVLVLALRRRIPAPVFLTFFAVHTARSLYMMAFLTGAAYTDFRLWTAPWLDGLAALSAVEAFVLICWRLPRFRWFGAGTFAALAVLGAAVAVAGAFVFPWEIRDRFALVAALERNTGLLLAATLAVAVLLMDRFRAVDRGALHHASALAVHSLAGGVAWVVHMRGGGVPGSLVASGGALAAYVMWCWTVRGIRVDREKPGGPLDPQEVERAWGASA